MNILKRITEHYPSLLRVSRYSNKVVGLFSVVAIMVSFVNYTFPYVLLLSIGLYILWLQTKLYIDTNREHCPWRRKTDRIECQVASLQTRVVIVSNLVTIILATAAIGMILILGLASQVHSLWIHDPSDQYGYGLYKLIVMFLVVCKIHHTKLLQSLTLNYLATVRHMTIPLDHIDGGRVYPKLWIDGHQLGEFRYRVVVSHEQVGIVFEPPLSMGYDTTIEFEMIEPDQTHQVSYGDTCGIVDHRFCAFSCQTTLVPRRRIPTIS